MDKFTIEAIDNTDPGNPITVIPETTYDFEGATPMTKTVFMTHRTAWDKSITVNRDANYMFDFSFVRLFGKVLWDGYTDVGRPFRIDDGSGRPVQVIAPGHGATPDSYVIVTGTLKQILWPKEPIPINDRTLTARPENVLLISP